MYRAIKNYCDDQSISNGLFLIDMPTGFGKTHNVLDYIYETAMDDSRSQQKLFFITTLKKNLPKDDLRKRFERAGNIARFREKFLFIDSNADCVIERLTKELIRSIPDNIKKTDEYKALDRDVKFIQNSGVVTKPELRPIVARVKDDLRQKSEPQFRNYVSTLICNQFPTVQARLQAIRTSKEWQWLGELYPAVFTRDRQIIFMSIDKFLARNSTIVEPSYMFYNSDIINDAIIFIDDLDIHVADGRLLNPEFAKLTEAIIDRREKGMETRSLENAASLTSVKVNTFITNLLREDWTDDRIQKWKDLRELVLRKPTMSATEVDRNFIAKNFYVRLPPQGKVLFYKQDGDYSDIQVSFMPTRDCPYQVSETAARLRELMEIDGVRKMFYDRGWATSFAPNDYILSPALFNNIYKGALGEAIGCYLFQKFTGVNLEEIDDPAIFERFDFKIKGTPVYVDFKHWQESDTFDAEQQHQHIFKKLRECNGKCAIIVNILAQNNYPCHRTDNDLTILEVPYLYGGSPLTPNQESIYAIRRCLSEFSN